jgi:Fe-S-cluster containining protein
MPRLKYDCSDCIAICCSIYERVPVTDSDLKRMSGYFKITTEQATRKFTKVVRGERVLRRRADDKMGEACKFLSAETRRCTIYEARPDTCREWPHVQSDRCVYYDMLNFERRLQGTHDVVPSITLKVFNQDE